MTRSNSGYAPPKRSGKILVGMDAIADYYGRDQRTVRSQIERDGFPATKVNGRWESHTDLIDEFQYRKISGQPVKLSGQWRWSGKGGG